MASDASPAQGEIGRGVQRYISQGSNNPRDIDNDYPEVDSYIRDDGDPDMPPPLAEAGVGDIRPGRNERGLSSRGGVSHRDERTGRTEGRESRARYSSPSDRGNGDVDLDEFRLQRTSSEDSELARARDTRQSFPSVPAQGFLRIPLPRKAKFSRETEPLARSADVGRSLTVEYHCPVEPDSEFAYEEPNVRKL